MPPPPPPSPPSPLTPPTQPSAPPSHSEPTTTGRLPNVGSIGCQNCREQHLKCDRVTPTCGRCRQHGRQCRRAEFKIRLTKNSFARQQRWIKTPRHLVFIDETRDVSSVAQDPDDAVNDDELRPDSPPVSSGLPGRSDLPRIARSGDMCQSNAYSIAPASPTDRFILHEESGFASDRWFVRNANPYPYPYADAGGLRPSIYLLKPIWPLTDVSEAILFRHFVQKLAIWLDLCDPHRSFETTVPQRAGQCPILLNAIFALAARHMSHISDFDPLASNRYHQECLKYLIPMLDHEATVSDENLFAATIILRVLEEMEVKNMGTDNHGYLLGIHAFVKGGDRYLVAGSLSAACFWIGLRQEIYSAVMNHQPVRINLNHALVDRSLGPADDHTWANRAVVHCADVLNFCFSEERTYLVASRWRELNGFSQNWYTAIPASFEPLFKSNGGHMDAFPEIWYQSSCHVIGVQHHHLAELFLARFNPEIPRIGVQRKAAEGLMTERIQDLVRRVCGIGLGNQWTPPSMFTACMAIAAFGDYFHTRQDLNAMLEILKKTERDHARPTEAVQNMCQTWAQDLRSSM